VGQMSESRRQRGVQRGERRRVGDPNVLSDAVSPNVLSGTAAAPPVVLVTAREGSEGRRTTGAAAPKQGVRLPSFGTVIFLGFIAITGFRLLGQVVQGFADGSPAATRGVDGEAGVQALPGQVVFGIGSDGDCGVLGSTGTFPSGAEVWWSARLTSEQGPQDEVVVVLRRDEFVLSSDPVPPDPPLGTWSVLCNSAPVRETDEGRYVIEVWDTSGTARYAMGEFRLTPS